VADVDRGAASFFGLSLLAFGSLAASMTYFLPPLGLENDERLEAQRQLLVQHYLSAAAERETEPPPREPNAETERTAAGSSGQATPTEAGAMGKITSKSPR